MLKKKIKKILVGTNNIGKLKEIKDLLPKTLEIYSTSDLKLKVQLKMEKLLKKIL